LTKPNMLGLRNEAVVVQEFLAGQEYVVDTVSRNGHHKVVAVWQYDKREANGVNFVYHGMTLIDAKHPDVTSICEYMCRVLDALRIRHGPGHGEVIMTRTGPCLVEVGARPHGGEGSWLPVPNQCIGYNVCSASIDSLFEDKFNALPDIMSLSKGFYGGEMYFVSRVSGQLRAFDRIDQLTALASYKSHIMFGCKLGQPLRKTVDCMSTPGGVIFISDSQETLARDLETFRTLDLAGFFIVDPLSSPSVSRQSSIDAKATATSFLAHQPHPHDETKTSAAAAAAATVVPEAASTSTTTRERGAPTTPPAGSSPAPPALIPKPVTA